MRYELIGNSLSNYEVGILLPTYREAENISNLIDDIESLNLNASIMVIDDSSPYETEAIVQQKQEKYNNILLCIRPKKSGLGTAITDGFKFYLSQDPPPKFVFTMDSDYSHNPKDIPRLLEQMREEDCAIVIGSRYVKEGRIEGWPISRKILSKTANTIAKTLLGLKPKDCTSGFRCYSTKFLKTAISNFHSHTYEIQIETIRQASLRHFCVKEIPVLFVNRKTGKSKLSWNEIQSFLGYTLKAISRS
jgi:dolichol-phosphate mannosyltransferase